MLDTFIVKKVYYIAK